MALSPCSSTAERHSKSGHEPVETRERDLAGHAVPDADGLTDTAQPRLSGSYHHGQPLVFGRRKITVAVFTDES